MIVLWIVVGALAGWAGGRALVLNRRGVLGDVLAGVLGSVSVAGAIQLQQAPPNDALAVALGGLAGALAATFVRRAYSDRFRRALA